MALVRGRREVVRRRERLWTQLLLRPPLLFEAPLLFHLPQHPLPVRLGLALGADGVGA